MLLLLRLMAVGRGVRRRGVIPCANNSALWRYMILPGKGLSVGRGVGRRWGELEKLSVARLCDSGVVTEIPVMVRGAHVRLSYRSSLGLQNPGLVGVGVPRIAEGRKQGWITHKGGW